MEKTMVSLLGKNAYFLGIDKEGIYYWLKEGTWDCDWYWGFGYVETYIRNKFPGQSRDINSHQHFGELFLNGKKNGFDQYNDFFVSSPLTEKEKWEFIGLMESFYIAREYSDMLHRGGTHFSTNPVGYLIKSEEEYKRINKVVIPAIMKEIYKLLSPEDFEEEGQDGIRS